ncbi:anaerobic sulfatase maturase [Proteiniclasticum ruminis]|uniref:Radical SAM core domain-containing protein n=1 Tax=Proteiniclasticum ruminis TaxID=398199 RepID=A0A1I5E0R1_9CLOT|nr:anaerobic sulfatase maturase [Proteiniclasticum ruminis]SFO04711.1 uncharacterized protein SAMN04488695_11223 [Proteiniclasticum ruminis]
MPNQTILIKPASGYCNMNCSYCFYNDVTNHRATKNYGFMTMDTVEEFVRKAFAYADSYVGFAFQGGEPTLVGIEFYKGFIGLVEKYNTKGIHVEYSLQTNGTTLHEGWAEFFRQHNFLIGLSMDGPAEIHDLNRVDYLGNGTYKEVLKAAMMLRKHKVEFNVLTVVTRNVARHPGKVYQFLKKNGFMYMQFIPCLDRLDVRPGGEKFSLTPEDYGRFLCQIFDLWHHDLKQNIPVSVRMFDNLIQILLGYSPESCDMAGVCSVNTVVEADGSVYPCDFYVLDQWKLGSILQDDFSSLKKRDRAIHFVDESKTKNMECFSCDYFALCKSGCKRHYVESAASRENYYCSSYKKFYAYSFERLREVAQLVRYYKKI